MGVKTDTIILWFRNDLRLHDQEALFRAVSKASNVLPVYCFDYRHFAEIEPGLPKTGLFRAQFLLETLQNLRLHLQQKGADLILLNGRPEVEIPKLAAKTGAQAVYASQEVTSEETDVEERMEKNLWKMGVDFSLFWQASLLHIDDLPHPIANLPDVFTQFRKSVERYVKIRKQFPEPERIPFRYEGDTGVFPTLEALGLPPAPPPDPRAVLLFKGGETEALRRLDHYLWKTDCLKEYKETRNGLLGADYSSKFSAWLANGSLSPRRIYDEVKKYEAQRISNDSTYWLIFELFWRDYFRFVSKRYGNRIFKIGGLRNEPVRFRKDPALLQKWQEGRTGIPFIDANMRELRLTGFMSNRGRQNVASFLVKDLHLNWIHGANYFESMLIDYDPCSNWGNWNYVAGVGNDPRENRYFNILSQAKRYDPKGEYVKHWLPELESLPTNIVHAPPKPPGGYCMPLVPFEKWGN